MTSKFGFRFSTNAANASLASADRTRTENSWSSSFTARSSSSRVDDLISRLHDCSAAGGLTPIRALSQSQWRAIHDRAQLVSRNQALWRVWHRSVTRAESARPRGAIRFVLEP